MNEKQEPTGLARIIRELVNAEEAFYVASTVSTIAICICVMFTTLIIHVNQRYKEVQIYEKTQEIMVEKTKQMSLQKEISKIIGILEKEEIPEETVEAVVNRIKSSYNEVGNYHVKVRPKKK